MPAHGSQSIAGTATPICANSAAVALQNTGAVAVTIGGPNVTVGNGLAVLPPNMPIPVLLNQPPANIPGNTIYGISGTAGQNVVYHTHAFGAA